MNGNYPKGMDGLCQIEKIKTPFLEVNSIVD
jgi:hypothetical protein